MRKKTIKPKKRSKKPGGKTWNGKTRLVGAIRKIWQYSPHRREVLRRAKEGYGYKCAMCGDIETEVHVDHINPVVPIETGFPDWHTYIMNMFGGTLYFQGVDHPFPEGALDNFRVLCVPCHATITDSQTVLREKYGSIPKRKPKS